MRRLLLSCLLLAATTLLAQDLPTYRCARTLVAPIIDGSGADTVWSNTPTLSLVDVEDLTSQKQHSRPTSARMLWDDDHLYFLFTMVDADVWSTYTNRDDQLYQEEVVEVFIDPDGDGLNYAEIEVNPLNTVFDLLLSRPWADSGSGFAQWNPEFASAVGIDGTLNDGTDEDVSWTVEIALPWVALATDLRDVMNGQSLPPMVGDLWRLNIYRFERIRTDGAATAEASAWSPVGVNDFHRPDRFGAMTFVDAVTSVDAESWAGVKVDIE